MRRDKTNRARESTGFLEQSEPLVIEESVCTTDFEVLTIETRRLSNTVGTDDRLCEKDSAHKRH